MSKKKKKSEEKFPEGLDDKTHIFGAGDVVKQPITETLEVNYMPYAMSVIMSRAIPEIDGFKPSHRKILYTMYKMGLLTGGRSKSANIVGATMRLNPHGDAAIYETMVRLSKGYEALLHPYVDSKGNFGKAYSRDMTWAASRYTEAKLESLSAELFSDIEKDAVDFADNYDATTKEPVLLPATFPSVLVNANMGIAVGMASSICSFNLEEVCNTTIELIKNPDYNVADSLAGPDFAGGGFLIYDRASMEKIYETGRGSVKIRAAYAYDKAGGRIDVTEIPPTTTCEAIIDKIIEKNKAGSLKEISDVRDETDKTGLKIAIDLKRGTDPEKLMKKLFDSTPLQDAFYCNFNVLIKGEPRVLGVKELLFEWLEFRTGCVRRRTNFDLKRCVSRLRLLKGLEKILLDIDKAIAIVRNSETENEVVPNLMKGFQIDKIQAEFIAEIRLRRLNKEYVLERLRDVEKLEKAIKELNDILSNPKRIEKIIISELKKVIEKYARPRKTKIIDASEIDETPVKEEISDYPVTIFFTKEGYFKKITPLSLRMSGANKLKDGDEIAQSAETTNAKELIFFTDKNQAYKTFVSAFDDSKASVLGDYAPAKLEMDEDEAPLYMAVTDDYSGYMLFFFENGKLAKVEMNSYRTVNRRRKLVKAFSAKSPAASIMYIREDAEIVVASSDGRRLLFNTKLVGSRTTKDTAGVAIMSLKKGRRVVSAREYVKGEFVNPRRYAAKGLPAAGALLSAADSE